MKRNVLLFFGFLLLFVGFIGLASTSDTAAAGAGALLFTSSNQAGATTNLRAEFSNSRCGSITKPFDAVGVSAFNLENPFPSSINFATAELELKLYGEVGTPPELVRGTVTERIVTDSGAVLKWIPDGGARELRSDSFYEVFVNGVNIASSNLVGFGIDFYYQGATLNSGWPICFGWGYGDDPGGCTEFDPWCYIKRFNESGIIPTATPRPISTVTPVPSGSLTPTVTPTSVPSRTPTPSATASPTSTPTATATPTPTPVSMEELGFVNQEAVEVWVSPGQTVPAFSLTSISATQFTFLGYPTAFGSGINSTPASGGTLPGRTTQIGIQVVSNVPHGVYTGVQRIIAADIRTYAEIPVTVHVGQFSPTATPTQLPTATPTVVPTPVPLSISSVLASPVNSRVVDITWSTSVPSTSFVQYGTKATQLTSYSPELPDLVTAHLVKMQNLQPNKKYYYRVHSRSQSGEWATSAVYSFTTPRK